MQWTVDRNGGFSRADFAQLYAPPLMDPVYGFQAVNVEAQLRTPTSLLRWMHRFIALRKEHPVFGLGTYEPIETSNPRIFAVLRRFEDDLVLCVHNLARSAQAVELDLSAARRAAPRSSCSVAALPPDRRAELPVDARSARLLLVPAGRRRARTRSDDRRRATPHGRDRAPGSGRGVGVAGGPALVRVQVAPRHRSPDRGERRHRRRAAPGHRPRPGAVCLRQPRALPAAVRAARRRPGGRPPRWSAPPRTGPRSTPSPTRSSCASCCARSTPSRRSRARAAPSASSAWS